MEAARDRAGDPRAGQSASPARTPAREVRFERVGFQYRRRRTPPHSRIFSISVSAAEKVALVGLRARQITVFQLLLRYYDPDAGAITLDGVELKKADPKAVRRRIALVPQDPVIFAARSPRTYATVGRRRGRRGARRVRGGLCHRIYRAPAGGHSYFRKRGVRLSGGSASACSIGGALLADARCCSSTRRRARSTPGSESYVAKGARAPDRGRTTLVARTASPR